MNIELRSAGRALARTQGRLLVVGAACIALLSAGGLRLEAQAGSQSDGGLTVIQVNQIKPQFFMIAGAGGNVGVQIGRDGVIVIDTGTADKADLLLAEIKRLTTLPIRYIINTSADPDHVGGNEKLSRAGQSLVVLSRVREQSGLTPILAEERVLRRMSARTGEQPPYPVAAWPTSTYSAASGEMQRKMVMNMDAIQVMSQPAAHADGDSLVYFRRSDVLVTGDIVDMTRFPMIDTAHGGSIQGILDSLNRIIDMTFSSTPILNQDDSITMIIPGHGRLITQTEVVDYRDMVRIIRDRVQASIKAGKTLEQIQQANPTEGYRRRYGTDSGSWTTNMFVEAIYKGLTRSGG